MVIDWICIHFVVIVHLIGSYAYLISRSADMPVCPGGHIRTCIMKRVNFG